jgi:crossover junction endodeoxyribonuclease RuvC
MDIRDRVRAILRTNNPDLVVIESYAFGAKNQAHQIGELGGVLRVMIDEEDFKLIEVTPGQLKQYATGKGSAKKDMVIKEVYKRWGFEAEISDTADAYVLSRIGLAYLREETNLTGFQYEIIQKLREKNRELKPGVIRKPTTRRAKDGTT